MIAICVGHSRLGDKGALSVDGVSEWNFNYGIAQRVKRHLEGLGHEVAVISSYPRNSYGSAMAWLAGELSKIHAEAALELHFNSSEDEQSNGHEWLHWNSSPRGKALAKALQSRMQNTFPTLRSRGLVPISSGDRGAQFLRLTPCPAVICEPFFGTNHKEWELFNDQAELYAEALALGIDDWKGGSK